MSTRLDIDEDVVAAAREIASDGHLSLDSVVSDLARRGLTHVRIEVYGELPVVRVPEGTPALTPEMVRRALDEG